MFRTRQKKTDSLLKAGFLTEVPTAEILGSIFYTMLLLFFLMCIAYGAVYICGGVFFNELHSRDFYGNPEISHIPSGLLYFFAVLLSGLLVTRLLNRSTASLTEQKAARFRMFLYAVIIALLAFGMRMLFWKAFYGEAAPFDDFAQSFARAVGDMEGGNMGHARYFPAYMNWSLFEHFISGGDATFAGYYAVLRICIICNVVTAVIIFFTGITSGLRDSLSFMAALFYSFYPPGLFFSMIGAPDHITVMFISIAILLLTLTWKAETIGIKIILSCLASLCAGLGTSVKSFAPIVVVAFFITLVIDILNNMHTAALNTYHGNDKEYADKNKKEIKNKKVTGIRYILCALAMVIILFAGQSLVNKFIVRASEKHFGMELGGSDATMHYIMVGLNVQGEGQIHLGNQARQYLRELQDGVPVEEAKAHAMDTLITGWTTGLKENPLLLPKFIIYKTIWAFQDDVVPGIYFNEVIGLRGENAPALLSFTKQYGASFSQMYYFLLMLLCLAGTWGILIKKNTVDPVIMLNGLIIYGFFALMLLSEAQSRYKFLVVPYFCIFAALGLDTLMSVFSASKSEI